MYKVSSRLIKLSAAECGGIGNLISNHVPSVEHDAGRASADAYTRGEHWRNDGEMHFHAFSYHCLYAEGTSI